MSKILETPLRESEVRGLEAGDEFYLSGRIYTARDAAHQKMIELVEAGRELPFKVDGLGLFHCGPLVKRNGEGWEVVAAGPTTSRRLEPVEPEFLRLFLPRVIIGKGGMGSATLDALGEHGSVYTQFTGGAAVVAAQSISRVEACWWLDELGMPEAVWLFEINEFGPLTVTMDTHGRSLHAEVKNRTTQKLKQNS